MGKQSDLLLEEFNVSLGTYYYWYPRYVEMGIFGLFDSKRGPKIPHNKTSDNVASKVVDTAEYHPELDALEISRVLECSSGHKPSVSTVQRILRLKGMNRPKGRRSKKNDGEKEDNNSSLQKGVKKVKKKRERSNVYTNPPANPQRNPNVDPKRREPLTDVEIKAIKEILKK
jgi:transposase